VVLLSWLPALFVVLIVAIGYFLNRDRLVQAARAATTKSAFSAELSLPSRDAFPLAPSAGQDKLEGHALQAALKELCSYAKRLKPDWIVGVHPGGRMLSVLLADAIEFPHDRCLFIRTSADRHSRVVFEPSPTFPNSRLEGTMLVVDDISRSGDTLETIKRFLIEKNYYGEISLERAKFAVLLVVAEPDDPPAKFRPDWVYYRTDKRDFRLPWSELSVKIGSAYAHRRQKMAYDDTVIRQYERLVSDFSYALSIAQKYVNQSSATNFPKPAR
jgi:hypoxanthine phosphoribosyltransferase